jgi:hypothetical protein
MPDRNAVAEVVSVQWTTLKSLCPRLGPIIYDYPELNVIPPWSGLLLVGRTSSRMEHNCGQ